MFSKYLSGGLVAIMLVATAVVFPTVSALADDADEWRVAAISGRPFVSTDGVQPVSLIPGDSEAQGKSVNIGDILKPGMWVVTPNDARVLLVRGNETIIVAPGSSMGLPKVAQDGLGTTIMHSLGSLLLSVDRKANPHFQVITPFLTAVVKGTTFTTTVENRRSKVHVFEGAVRVRENVEGGPFETAAIGIMFVDEDPNADFDIFVLDGPMAPASEIDPVRIGEDAKILPIDSDVLIEPGQTAGIALDSKIESGQRNNNGPSIDPGNFGPENEANSLSAPPGTFGIPPNNGLGRFRDRGIIQPFLGEDKGMENSTQTAGTPTDGGTGPVGVGPKVLPGRILGTNHVLDPQPENPSEDSGGGGAGRGF